MKEITALILGKSVKTTLLGYAGAAILAIGDLFATGGTITLATVGKAAFVALFGRLVKDAGQTGV